MKVKSLVVENRSVISRTDLRHKGTFLGNRNVLYLHCGGGYTCVRTFVKTYRTVHLKCVYSVNYAMKS